VIAEPSASLRARRRLTNKPFGFYFDIFFSFVICAADATFAPKKHRRPTPTTSNPLLTDVGHDESDDVDRF